MKKNYKYYCKYKNSRLLQEYIFEKFSKASWSNGRNYLNFNKYRGNNDIKDDDEIAISLYYEEEYKKYNYWLKFSTTDTNRDLMSYELIDFEKILRKKKFKKFM